MIEKVIEHLKLDEFQEAMQLLLHNPDKFSHEDRKKSVGYCLSQMPSLADEVFTIAKVKNDTDLQKYAYHHVNLTNNNKLIYAIELGLDAVAEKLAEKCTNLDFAIYKCMLLKNHELGTKLAGVKENLRRSAN